MTNENKDSFDGIEVRIGDRVVGHVKEFKPIEHKDKTRPCFVLGEDRPCVICGEKDCGHLNLPERRIVRIGMRSGRSFESIKRFIAMIPPADMRNVLRSMEDEKHPFSMGCTVGEEPRCELCENAKKEKP